NAPQSLFDVDGNASFGTYAGSIAAPTNGIIVSGTSGFGTSSPFGFFSVQSPVDQTAPVFVVATSTPFRNLLSIAPDGFGTTTVNGLNISAFATTTSN